VGTGRTGGVHRSDQCTTMPSGDFEAKDTRWDRKACVEAKRSEVVGHPSDGATTKIPERPFGGVYLSLM
jgi:hypothetical protein